MQLYDFDHPLRPVVALWLEKIRLTKERKHKEWELDAIDGFRQLGIGFRLVHGRIGGGIHDHVAAGFDQGVFNA